MRISLFALFVFVSSLISAPPEIPKSDSPAVKTAPVAAPPFRFPLSVVKPIDRSPPAPKADPSPAAVPVLSGDVLYVIPSETPFLLLPSPADKVKLTRATGPITLFAKFLDDPGEAKLRTFAQKNVAIVQAEAKASGRVELIAVPQGITDEKAAARQLIDVNQAPQPPPDVTPLPKPLPPPVDPKPEPKPNPVVGDIHVILVDEDDDRTLLTANFINDLAFWKRMQAKQIYFRNYDQNEDAAIKKGFVAEALKVGLPAVLVMNDGEVLKRIPRPKDTAAMEAILKEVRP